MFAVLAVIAFVVAFILNLVHSGKFVEDFLLLGLALFAAHFVWTLYGHRTAG